MLWWMLAIPWAGAYLGLVVALSCSFNRLVEIACAPVAAPLDLEAQARPR